MAPQNQRPFVGNLSGISVQQYQQAFIELALAQEVLRFGEFSLKSGRTSPYFFNAGLFRSGASLAAVGEAYAQAVTAAGIDFDMLLGPAYKGIPLATATAIGFHQLYQRDVPFAYNRKEAKRHGEGGQLVGAPLSGRVLIIDDVITAGTAIREVMGMVADTDASVAGIVVGLDRQERGQGDYSAIEEIEQEFSVPVLSIINLTELLGFLQTGKGPIGEGVRDAAELEATVANIKRYRQQYGTVTLAKNS